MNEISFGDIYFPAMSEFAYSVFLLGFLLVPAVISFGNGADWWRVSIPGLKPSEWTAETPFVSVRKAAYRISVLFSFFPFVLGLGFFAVVKGHEL